MEERDNVSRFRYRLFELLVVADCFWKLKSKCRQALLVERLKELCSGWRIIERSVARNAERVLQIPTSEA